MINSLNRADVVVVKFPFATGLLKESILKSSIATIQKDYIIHKLGSLKYKDIEILNIKNKG